MGRYSLNLLTAAKVTKLHRDALPGKAADGGNLYLHDGRFWRMRFLWQGKSQTLSIGRYPELSLAHARAARDRAQAELAQGIDPRRGMAEVVSANTFKAVSDRWLKAQVAASEQTVVRHRQALKRLNDAFGSKAIDTVTPSDIRVVLDGLHEAGTHEVLRRMRGTASQVFRYAALHEITKFDPTLALRDVHKRPAVRHHPHLEGERAIGELCRRLRGYRSVAGAGHALRFQLLTMARPGEASGALWSEFELTGDAPTWRIPAERMKKGKPHHVPLSRQAVALLEEMKIFTGGGALVFPGQRDSDVPLTIEGLGKALRAVGYLRSELVPHGLRGTASTYLNSQGKPSDDIELCLAHVDSNKVRASHNHSDRLPQRRELLQFWADELDRMRDTVA